MTKSEIAVLTSNELAPAAGWISTGNARLPVPEPAARGLLFRTISLASGLLGRNEVPDVLTVLNINPRLFWAWLFFASRLMPYGKLPGTVREKIILRTGWNCRSRYEWGQHVDIALSIGVSADDIVAVTKGPSAFPDRHEKAVMQACDEVFNDKYISDETWTILSEKYSQKLLIEIVILIGHYEMIAGFLNSAGLALEPAIEKKLQDFYQSVLSKP
jgi:alkylhydroperoxidase family enzyme